MNQQRFAGMCKQVRGAIRQGWGRLINDPRVEDAGAREQHAGQVQARYGRSKEQAARSLKDFFARNRDWDLSNRAPAPGLRVAADHGVSALRRVS
jgi:uncharacterized protein YjbJ (UPF0337 family)